MGGTNSDLEINQHTMEQASLYCQWEKMEMYESLSLSNILCMSKWKIIILFPDKLLYLNDHLLQVQGKPLLDLHLQLVR